MNTSTTKKHGAKSVGKKEAGNIKVVLKNKPYEIGSGFKFNTTNNKVQSIDFDQIEVFQPKRVKSGLYLSGAMLVSSISSQKNCSSSLMAGIGSLNPKFILNYFGINIKEGKKIFFVFAADIAWKKSALNSIKHGALPVLVMQRIGKEYLLAEDEKLLSTTFKKNCYFLVIRSKHSKIKHATKKTL